MRAAGRTFQKVAKPFRTPAIRLRQAIGWARQPPVAMLFVPSIGGISHHWAEDTREADLVLGLLVLDDAARRILAA